MPSSTLFRLLVCFISLLLPLGLTGCGGADDAAKYSGNEQAMREHMQAVEAEERQHFEETSQTNKK